MKILTIMYKGKKGVETNRSPKWSESQKLGYITWGRIAFANNIKLTRVNVFDFNGKSFTNHWEFSPEKNTFIKVAKSNLKPDAIYDKCRNYDKDTGYKIPEIFNLKLRIAENFKILNQPEFSELMDNKLNQAVVFSEYMPKTEILKPGDKIKYEGTPIVAKRYFGSGGKQVDISMSDYTAKDYMVWQEFIDGKSNGVLQDIRVVFINEDPIYALTRKAAKDSLFTNFHQGAEVEILSLADVQDTVQIAKEIAKNILSIYPNKIFSLDFLITPKGIHYLIEINTMPGLDVFDRGSLKVLEDFLSKLTLCLVD